MTDDAIIERTARDLYAEATGFDFDTEINKHVWFGKARAKLTADWCLPTPDIDPDTKAGMLAGLEQLRAQVWPGTESWAALPYKQLVPLAERACLVVEGLSANEVLLLGTFLAASARTQLQGEVALASGQKDAPTP